MPYSTNADLLLEPVRAHLPPHAHDIYRAAFNRAWQQYGVVEESRIHPIARTAVKCAFEKVAGCSMPRDDRRWS